MSTTPLPWKIGFNDGSGAGQYDEGIWIVGPDSLTVVMGGQDQGVKVGVRTPDDARLIERAVNNHDKLLKKLESLETVARSYLRYPLEGEEPGYDAKDVLVYCDEARAAIEEAKK